MAIVMTTSKLGVLLHETTYTSCIPDKHGYKEHKVNKTFHIKNMCKGYCIAHMCCHKMDYFHFHNMDASPHLIIGHLLLGKSIWENICRRFGDPHMN